MQLSKGDTPMKKMDRRNYLMRMGTGAAGIIGASVSNIFGQKTKQKTKQTTSENLRMRAPGPKSQDRRCSELASNS